MSIRRKKLLTLFIPAITVLVLDQVTKYMIRTNPGLQRVEVIEGWLAFNFTKNPGMALGMDWLSTPVISIIAILATVGIFTYIFFTLQRANFAYLACMGLILGGALGNIADRLFMGVIGGYGGVLDGHVVDFIHFTLTVGSTPVFPYIFNIADVAISTSIIVMLIFHRSIMPAEQKTEEPEAQTEPDHDVEAPGEFPSETVFRGDAADTDTDKN
ncbi:MAG: signal peptidase II [Balneolaceae bacterium]